MGLKETFQKAAQTAMKAAGNVKKTVHYYSTTASDGYNPATGTVSEYEVGYKVDMFFDENITQDLPNISVDDNQKLGYIAVKDLKPTPQVKDKISIGNESWTVVNIYTDPADALWIIKIQRQ